MPDGRPAVLLLPPEPLGERLGVFVFCLAVGAWFIAVGRMNVRTREAEEGGKRGLFYRILGRPKIHQGRAAVAMGWLRIVLGGVVIVFGAVFLLFGAFLKDR